MKYTIIVALGVFLLVSCKNEVDKGIAENTKENQKEVTKDSDSLVMENGLRIHWLNHGNGTKLKDGECVDIEYKVFLEDGKLIEGSHMLNRPFPFMVGFQMQTIGWDIALRKLKVGDEVEVFLPSKLARGEKGIEGMIPPNANNILQIKVIQLRPPTKTIDGVKTWLIEENAKNKARFNRDNTIVFHAMTSSPSNPRYFNSFRENKPFELKMKDAGLVPGLKKALNNAKKADRMYVYVPPSEAYGDKGYLDLVKPNEPLFYNLYVMDVY